MKFASQNLRNASQIAKYEALIRTLGKMCIISQYCCCFFLHVVCTSSSAISFLHFIFYVLLNSYLRYLQEKKDPNKTQHKREELVLKVRTIYKNTFLAAIFMALLHIFLATCNAILIFANVIVHVVSKMLSVCLIFYFIVAITL